MKFSIRDLLWLTVVVALALSWCIDRRNRPQELVDAIWWKTRTGALEEVLRDLDWDVQWEPESVRLSKGTATFVIDTTHFQPSAVKRAP